jgi:hypothetical protein
VQSTETFVEDNKINQGQGAEHRNICRIIIENFKKVQSTETFVGNKKINQGQGAEHRNICRTIKKILKRCRAPKHL